MNFWKWFLYLLGLAAFIWFVFFRPMNDGDALASNTEDNGEVASTDNDYTGSDSDGDYTDGTEEIDYSNTTGEETTGDETPQPDADNTKSSDNITSGKSINLDSKYLIVVGSFGVKSNADRLLKKTIAEGRDAKIKYINGLHRVVAAASDDESNAKDLRAHFTHVYKVQAFILKQ